MNPSEPLPISERSTIALETKARAREVGFDVVGIAAADSTAHAGYLRRWLDEGRHGTMHYLAERFEERVDPATYLPGARSVICVALNYHRELAPVPEADRSHHARIARYALGDDYHALIKPRLYAIADWLRERAPGTRTRCGVDTVPVLERELAARGGVGWVGKNTCVINAEVGSWLLLGEVLTTLELPPDEPAIDRCGSCTRCIDACPTAAITGPYQLDARRCISYLNIEHDGPIDPDLRPAMGEWLFGCDICQDVCPYNRAAPSATDPAMRPRWGTGTLDLREVLGWSLDEYRVALRNTPLKRVKLAVLQDNARIVQRNLQSSNQDSTGSRGEGER